MAFHKAVKSSKKWNTNGKLALPLSLNHSVEQSGGAGVTSSVLFDIFLHKVTHEWFIETHTFKELKCIRCTNSLEKEKVLTHFVCLLKISNLTVAKLCKSLMQWNSTKSITRLLTFSNDLLFRQEFMILFLQQSALYCFSPTKMK